MAAATVASTNPVPEADRKAFAPAVRALLAALADGRPATIAELAAAARWTPQETEAVFRALNGVEWDADGRVTGLGMTLNPTPHRVETGGHRLYGWCAPDTLEFLPAIGRTVQISSQCPATGQTVTMTAGPDGVRDIQPPGAVVSAVLSGDPDDVRGTMCDLGHFYGSAAGQWPAAVVDGAPLDSTGFAALASVLAERYTVVTYDPRGVGNSSLDNTAQDVTPEQQADDVHRLLAAVDGGPAHVFGSSGGAVVGLALVTAHPGQVRMLVAHEPPVIELLPDSARVRAQVDDIYDTYRTDGAEKAMAKFMAEFTGDTPSASTAANAAGFPGWTADAPRCGEPISLEQITQMRVFFGHFLAHRLRPTTRYQPDIEALRAAPARIVVAAGAASKGQHANRTAIALAEQPGTPVAEFPGNHGGFTDLPEQFGRVLDRVLTGRA